MYLLVEKGIRGGVFYIHKGRSKINDINTCNFMIMKNQVNILHIFMQIIFMVRQ